MPRDKSSTPPRRRGARTPAPRPRRSAATLLLGIFLGLIAGLVSLRIYHHVTRPAARFSAADSSAAPALSARPTTPAAASRPVPPPSRSAAQNPSAEEAPPFGISEDVFESGARIYRSRCAACHGSPGRSVTQDHPGSLQLWQKNRAGGTGVSHQTPSRIYRSIAEGNLAVGMPAYRGVLTRTQLWQVTLLLHSANQELPDPVLRLLDASAAHP